MNKKFATLITVFVICVMSVSSMAITNLHISLAADQVWSRQYPVTRTKSYSYASASLSSVYPSSGKDNYTKIRTRLVNTAGNLISTSSEVILTEGAGYENLYIQEGYLNYTTVSFQFRGNTNAADEAIVNYVGN